MIATLIGHRQKVNAPLTTRLLEKGRGWKVDAVLTSHPPRRMHKREADRRLPVPLLLGSAQSGMMRKVARKVTGGQESGELNMEG